MARKGKSNWKLTGRIKGDITNFVVGAEISSTESLLMAAGYVKAWRKTLKDSVRAAKGDDAVLQPRKLVITIYI